VTSAAGALGPDHSGYAATLAACRTAGTLAHLPLHELLSADDAEKVQAQAVRALGWTHRGYKVGATNLTVQQALACTEPVAAPVFGERELANGAAFALPPGVLGVECEYAFEIGRHYPAADGVLDLASLSEAVAECRAAIEVVGRRLEPDIPLNHKSVVADFGINVAFALGGAIPGWREGALLELPVTTLVDARVVAEGNGHLVLGNPLESLLWLARRLADRGAHLRAGEVVLTGTCTGITPVASGQTFEARFGDSAGVMLHVA
jgi:2-keto-4-pentenoate hydratase